MRVWKARSVFWDLEYWSLLRSPHSLDLMHITKNVCESLFGTLLNMPDKTKDGPKARNDLKFMGIRRELHPIVTTMMSRRRKRIRKCKTLANEKGRPRRRPVLITAPRHASLCVRRRLSDLSIAS